MAMLDEVLEDLLQVHFLRRPVDQSEHDRAEGRLHLRMLVELVQHDGRHGIALQVDDDAHPLAVRIILDVRDPVDLFVVRELGDLRDEIRLVHLIGNLDRKSTRLNSSHLVISYAVFCLKKKKKMKAYDVIYVVYILNAGKSYTH